MKGITRWKIPGERQKLTCSCVDVRLERIKSNKNLQLMLDGGEDDEKKNWAESLRV